MKGRDKNSQGSVAIIVVILILLLVVGAAAASYYFLWSQQALPQQVNQQYTTSRSDGALVPTMKPISDSDAISDIESELKSTNEGTIEADINSLNSAASAL